MGERRPRLRGAGIRGPRIARDTATATVSPAVRPGGSRLLVPALAAAASLAYMLPLRRYGLTLQDEGTLLYQIARVARGELPYVDFSTGYTPGYFAFNATV